MKPSSSRPVGRHSHPASQPEPTERLQKALARAGLGSRREMETWIEAGRIKVNGQVAKLGDSVQPGDRIQVDGRLLQRARLRRVDTRVLAYHKPSGEMCTRDDPENRPTVYQHLPELHNGRWISIGRLDFMTSGLLLFTNDGTLAHKLMHPSSELEREYAVRILGKVEPRVLERLQSGVELEDGPARFETITDGGGSGANHWYHVTLREGRKHEVRRLWESQGLTVSRLIRVRYGPVQLLPYKHPGSSWELTAPEIKTLQSLVGLQPVVTKPARQQRPVARQRLTLNKDRGQRRQSPSQVSFPLPAGEARVRGSKSPGNTKK